MHKLNLKEYTWEVFQISIEYDTYLELAAKMFLANIKSGQNLFDGVNVNYKELKDQWDNMSPIEQDDSIKELNDIISPDFILFEDLMEAWANDDRELFENLIS